MWFSRMAREAKAWPQLHVMKLWPARWWPPRPPAGASPAARAGSAVGAMWKEGESGPGLPSKCPKNKQTIILIT